MRLALRVIYLSMFLFFASSALAQTTSISLYSQPGDPFGGRPNNSGRTFLFRNTDGSFTAQAFDYTHDNLVDTVIIRFQSFDGFNRWDFEFSTAGSGSNMSPGYYDNGARWLPGSYGMDVGNGGGCLTSTSTFCIKEASFDYSNPLIPSVISFAVSFEFHCYGQPPALIGTINYSSQSSTSPSCTPLSVSGSMQEIEVGRPFSYKIDATGGVRPYNFVLQQGQLAQGLTLNSDGAISGTPAIVGEYPFNLYITDSLQLGEPTAHTAIAHFLFKVIDAPAPQLVIEGPGPPKAIKGIVYSHQFTATGGRTPYQWSVTEGKLPDGLDLSSSGDLQGTPSSSGTFNFTSQVADSARNTAKQSYSIVVVEPPQITSFSYKLKKGKLTIEGVLFDPAAKLFIDGNEVHPNSQDAATFFVKRLFLSPGDHEVRIVNPDGGSVTIALTV
jgi:hypothetical protein